MLLAFSLDHTADNSIALLEQLQLPQIYPDEIGVPARTSLLTGGQENFESLGREVRKDRDGSAILHEIRAARDRIYQRPVEKQMLYVRLLSSPCAAPALSTFVRAASR